jgi:uroporphyrin-III C-methyltransferase/precorrin-2 dehydrogenase/sirohydrochlorin ferrochelatase
MDYLPICLKVQGSPVLLVGGGAVATRKARLLLRAGAQLTVLAPELDQELQKCAESGELTWLEAKYRESALEGQSLVVAATSDSKVNLLVSEHARARSLPVNVVDSPELCTFIFPSIIDRNPLLIAVSSSGKSPVLARLLKRQIESLVPAGYGRLANWLGKLRNKVKDAVPDDRARRALWENIVEGSTAELVLLGKEEEAEQRLARKLANIDELTGGEVYLIGAGPGDPDLMTFKAQRLLQKADVVLYDRLVNPVILDMARKDAERIYVGKRRAEHTVPQPEINQLLVDLALEGKRVARLKGGDPFIFGRGGEEIELLAEHGINFQVVPGVTAASGAACYAGIPLTHRDAAQSVRFITGHTADNQLSLEWDQLQSESETLVFYMGLNGLPAICEKLIKHGRNPDTPIALVEKASTEDQKVYIGTLATMPGIALKEQPKAPTLIIVGAVVSLAKGLAWFGQDRQGET